MLLLYCIYKKKAYRHSNIVWFAYSLLLGTDTFIQFILMNWYFRHSFTGIGIYNTYNTHMHVHVCIWYTLNFSCYTWINNFDSLSLAPFLSLYLSHSVFLFIGYCPFFLKRLWMRVCVWLCDCCKISSLFNGVICSLLKIDLQLGLLTNCSMIVFTSHTQ